MMSRRVVVKIARVKAWPVMLMLLLLAAWPLQAQAQSTEPGAGMPLPQAKPERPSADLTPEDKSQLTPEQALELYKQHERHLRRIEGERDEVRRDVATLEEDRARLSAQLLEAAEKVTQSESRLNELEQQLEKLRGEEATVRVRLTEQHGEIGKLLAIMQRLGREPPPALVTQRDDALKMVRSGMLLNSFFPKLKSEADTLSAELSRLVGILTDLELRSRQLAEEKERWDSLSQETRDLIAARQQRLSSEQQRLSMLDQAAQRHVGTITDLGELLRALNKDDGSIAGLGAYERELRDSQTVELRPQATQAAFVQPGRLKPAIPFGQAKGLVLFPAVGSIKRSYGESDEFGIASRGISMETRSGALVKAPADGWVVFAGRFRTYRQLLIINAGQGYHILLAGMNEIHVRRGEFVLAGEPVAVMGREADAEETSGTGQTLYIEFRKDDRPVNPQPWWAAGLGKG
jgi:septal ring factor EnvC (AmiA/AmiB activator)